MLLNSICYITSCLSILIETQKYDLKNQYAINFDLKLIIYFLRNLYCCRNDYAKNKTTVFFVNFNSKNYIKDSVLNFSSGFACNHAVFFHNSLSCLD